MRLRLTKPRTRRMEEAEMMKKIKRIAALIVAGILLICISFASLAEEMPEENGAPSEAEVSAAAETNETIEAPEAVNTPAEDSTAGNGEAATVSQEPETAKESNPQETAEESKPQETVEAGQNNAEDYDIVIDDFDAGSVDPELVDIFFPNGTGAPEEASDDGTETAESGEIPADNENRLWIESKDHMAIHIGETAVLLAKAAQELNGEVTWQIRDVRWEEDVWQNIGTGSHLELDVTEAMADILIRFVAEDGTVSEIFEMNAAVKPEGQDERTDGEAAEGRDEEANGVIAGKAEEQTEVRNDETAGENDDNTETAADGTADEEQSAEIIRAWITSDFDGDLEEGAVVTLTANADPEMTGVNIWETQTSQADENAWVRIGYGDEMTVEITEANISNLYRFVMQDGPVSEEFRLNAATEEAEETAETEDAGDPEEAIGENTEDKKEIPFPENAEVSFVITWEDQAALGCAAIFTADIRGLDEYTYSMQWQWSEDGENWQDVDGETEIQMRQVITEENMAYFWRINITVTGIRETESLL